MTAVVGLAPGMIGCGDVFADVVHLIAFAGDQGPAFEADVADVFAVEREGSAVLAEVFAVLLGEAIQAGVTLEFTRPLAAAVGIDFLIQSAGDR